MTQRQVSPRVDGVLPTDSTIPESLPSQMIVIDDSNAHLWFPVVSHDLAQNGRSERHVSRSALAFRLRATGMSYDDIAASFSGDPSIAPLLPTPYGPQQVRDDVATQIDHLREEIQEALEDVVTLEIERFDRMLQALWPGIERGDTASINTALKVSERRSSLLGLDKPVRVDWRVELSSLLTGGAITIDDVRSQLEDEMYASFVQYLEERNEAMTVSDNPDMNFLFGTATLAGRFLPLDNDDGNGDHTITLTAEDMEVEAS